MQSMFFFLISEWSNSAGMHNIETQEEAQTAQTTCLLQVSVSVKIMFLPVIHWACLVEK